MNQVVLGMAGAARGCELHMGGYQKVYGVDLRLKKVMDMKKEAADAAKARYGFEEAVYDFEDLLKDSEINLIDICTPPYAHPDMIIKALAAGKNVICEKPLTGYFGREGDEEPIGDKVSKAHMYECMKEDIARLEKAVKGSGKHFCYAENFVYAPAVQRAAEIIRAKKSRILYLKGEESLKGSSSPVAGYWKKSGGGTLMRVGSHPLGAALYLKSVEAKARGEEIRPESVVADMTRITPSLSAYEHRHIAADPHDVEDLCTMCLTFTDGTKATIIATDALLGGSLNYVDCYCNDAAIKCNLTLADLMQTYMVDEDGMENVSLSEMLPIKTGWNNPFVVDDVIRGYAAEIQDFCEAVAYDREAQADFELAKNVTLAMYAAYAAAEEGKRTEF